MLGVGMELERLGLLRNAQTVRRLIHSFVLNFVCLATKQTPIARERGRETDLLYVVPFALCSITSFTTGTNTPRNSLVFVPVAREHCKPDGSQATSQLLLRIRSVCSCSSAAPGASKDREFPECMQGPQAPKIQNPKFQNLSIFLLN